MFDPCTGPRIMALPVGVDFASAFLHGLETRMHGQPLQNRALVRIYVNTRRTARRLNALLMQGEAKILPDIRVIDDLASEPGLLLGPASDALARQLAIAELVRAYLQQGEGAAPRAMVFDLAQSLIDLLDEMDAEGVAYAALETASPAHLSVHWQRNLAFLSILKTYLDNLEGETQGAAARQRLALARLRQQWQESPPQHPVIIAGSTGSRGTTTEFMRLVANLPQGAVVLPGFDFDMPDELWPLLGQEHPQYGFRALSERLDFDPGTVTQWHDTGAASPPRNGLVSLALRPAPVTAQWLAQAPSLLPDLPRACAPLTLIEAQTPRAEAGAIALCLRKALDAGKRAALVTPDRILARRVTAALQHWNITPDDSAGHPAPLTPPGMFLRMIAALFGQDLTPLALVELLKHPLCAGADRDTRAAHLSLTRRLETRHLRGADPVVDLGGLVRFDPAWIGWLHGLLADLPKAADTGVAQWATRHRALAEALCAGAGRETGSFVWEKEAGAVVLNVLTRLETVTGQDRPYTAAEYRALFQHLLQRQEVRDDPRQSHPDIAIWGTLEARVNSADLVILAGLNDGVWPRSSGQDTWLNRDIRDQIGLPQFERRIGLSAHDFQQSLGASEVVLSRAIRDGEAPTVASRWLMRLQNLLGGMGHAGKAELAAMRARGETLLAQARTLDQPESAVDPAPRPCPAPPVAARPDRLSVTRIETLIRDPYAIYAYYVLKLRKAGPLMVVPDPMRKGIIFHRVLERFVDETPHGLDNAAQVFDAVLDEVLAPVPWPATRRLWRAGFAETRDWFIRTEAERRAIARPYRREVEGQLALSPDFTLTAKADRIDLGEDGLVAIYDYKSGTKPSLKQLREFAVQLPLEGVIAQAGGFDAVPAATRIHLQLVYFGGKKSMQTLEPDFDVMDQPLERLKQKITRYRLPHTGFGARIRPELIGYASDYDQLSRFGEWQEDDPVSVQVIP